MAAGRAGRRSDADRRRGTRGARLRSSAAWRRATSSGWTPRRGTRPSSSSSARGTSVRASRRRRLLRQDVLAEHEVDVRRRRRGDVADPDHVRPRVPRRPRRGRRRRRRAGARVRLRPRRAARHPVLRDNPRGGAAGCRRGRGRRRAGRVAAGDPDASAPHAPRRASRQPVPQLVVYDDAGRVRRARRLRRGELQARRSSTRATTTAPRRSSGAGTPCGPPSSRRCGWLDAPGDGLRPVRRTRAGSSDRVRVALAQRALASSRVPVSRDHQGESAPAAGRAGRSTFGLRDHRQAATQTARDRP